MKHFGKANQGRINLQKVKNINLSTAYSFSESMNASHKRWDKVCWQLWQVKKNTQTGFLWR